MLNDYEANKWLLSRLDLLTNREIKRVLLHIHATGSYEIPAYTPYLLYPLDQIKVVRNTPYDICLKMPSIVIGVNENTDLIGLGAVYGLLGICANGGCYRIDKLPLERYLKIKLSFI